MHILRWSLKRSVKWTWTGSAFSTIESAWSVIIITGSWSRVWSGPKWYTWYLVSHGIKSISRMSKGIKMIPWKLSMIHVQVPWAYWNERCGIIWNGQFGYIFCGVYVNSSIVNEKGSDINKPSIGWGPFHSNYIPLNILKTFEIVQSHFVFI